MIIAATPAASRSEKLVDQLKPFESGSAGKMVVGQDGMIADAPLGTMIWRARCAPPPLKAASPEYWAVMVVVPVLCSL